MQSVLFIIDFYFSILHLMPEIKTSACFCYKIYVLLAVSLFSCAIRISFFFLPFSVSLSALVKTSLA